MAKKGKPQWALSPLPPDSEGLMIEILSPGAGQEVRAVILSDQITGLITHFIGGRTRPCTGDPATCEGCQYQAAKRWKGYLPCWSQGVGRYVLAELTTQAVRDCKELNTVNPLIRGKYLVLARPGKKPNGRVHAAVREIYTEPKKLPPAFDVIEALARIFEAPDRPKRLKKTKDSPSEIVGKLANETLFPTNDGGTDDGD